MKMWKVPIQDILPSTSTGDVILMAGEFPWSHAIELWEHSHYTHCGMVVRSSEMGFPKGTPEYLLWESNPLTNLPDFNHKKKGTSGPMLVDLRRRIETNQQYYKHAMFAFRHFHGLALTAEIVTKLESYFRLLHDKTFPDDLTMLKYLIEGRYEDETADPRKFFCSELLSATFMHLGYLSQLYPANAYEPADFSRKGRVCFLHRCFLGDEIRIDAGP
jgi:hypothetical protein